MSICNLVRKNIVDLAPYSTARDEYKGDIGVYLDANENPYQSELQLNRYPDPMQQRLKRVIGELKEVDPSKIFLGNGSDEAIDLIYRVFCEPIKDHALIIKPSYGMYTVAAQINNVSYTEVALDAYFQLDISAIESAITSRTKVIFLCSPNNPTGNLLNRKDVLDLCASFSGVVVIDEAYIDFASENSYIAELEKFENLIVLQTLSKAWGLAALRVGMAFASSEIIAYMNKVKYPYNVNFLSQEAAYQELTTGLKMFEQQRIEVISQRTMLLDKFKEIEYIEKIYPSEANFILIKVPDATELYNYLILNGIIVRNRTSMFGCKNTLRLTVGTPDENMKLLTVLQKYKS